MQKILFFHRIPPFVARASSADNALRHLGFKLGPSTRSVVFRSALHCRLLRFSPRLLQAPPARFLADQPNILPNPPTPAGVQQNAEPVQNLPQELEPIAEPALAPCPADEGDLFKFFFFALLGLVLLRFR